MFKKILLKVMCNKNGWLQAEIYPGPDGNVVWHTRGVRIVVREIHVVDVFRYLIGVTDTLKIYLGLESPPFPIHRFPNNTRTKYTEPHTRYRRDRSIFPRNGRQRELHGRVDWSIECLREGDRLLRWVVWHDYSCSCQIRCNRSRQASNFSR